MRIRHAEPEDIEALARMHEAQGFGYELPPLFADEGETDERQRRMAHSWIVRAVLEERPNEPEMAVLLRKTAEVYLLCGPERKAPAETFGKILALEREIRPIAARAGLTDAHCWLPPQIDKRFGRILVKRMGWHVPMWRSYSKEI